MSALKDYANIVNNEPLPSLGADTPLKNFTWSQGQSDGRTGREIILDWKTKKREIFPVQAEKALMVLRQIFDAALIGGGWATQTPHESKQIKPHHHFRNFPSLPWEVLPGFLDALHRNEPNASAVVVASVKVLFLTFL